MSTSEKNWTLWRAQMVAILRLELKKTLLARRGLWVYFLAFAPVLIFAIHAYHQLQTGQVGDIGDDTHIFAGIFQLFFLRLAVFFGCVGIFTNLFRGEMVEKSLHYYFLAPVRREVLMVGKFLSGLIAAAVIFGVSMVLQFFVLYSGFDSATRQEYFYHGQGLVALASYVGVTLLACLGYGSLFLAAGVLFRNPLVPALVLLVLEAISGFLPSFLQHFSVIFYLKSLCPVSVPAEIFMDQGPLAFLAVNAAPASVAVSILGLVVISMAALAYCAARVGRMEIDYAAE